MLNIVVEFLHIFNHLKVAIIHLNAFCNQKNFVISLVIKNVLDLNLATTVLFEVVPCAAIHFLCAFVLLKLPRKSCFSSVFQQNVSVFQQPKFNKYNSIEWRLWVWPRNLHVWHDGNFTSTTVQVVCAECPPMDMSDLCSRSWSW